MKHFVIYLVLGILFASFKSEAQKITLFETKANTVQNDIRKILIVGSGVIETRAFLELLSSKLISTLKDKKIDAKYYFKGKDTTQANNEMNQFLTDSFDAIIVFKPIDSSHYSQINYNRNTDVVSSYVGRPLYGSYSRSIDFEEIFDVQLYNPQNKTNLIWGATLGIDCDLGKKSHIKEIAKEILSTLKTNKVLN